MTIQEHVESHDDRSYCDICFLTWLSSRIVNIYGESENVDFVLRLREITERLLKGTYVGVSR